MAKIEGDVIIGGVRKDVLLQGRGYQSCTINGPFISLPGIPLPKPGEDNQTRHCVVLPWLSLTHPKRMQDIRKTLLNADKGAQAKAEQTQVNYGERRGLVIVEVQAYNACITKGRIRPLSCLHSFRQLT